MFRRVSRLGSGKTGSATLLDILSKYVLGMTCRSFYASGLQCFAAVACSGAAGNGRTSSAMHQRFCVTTGRTIRNGPQLHVQEVTQVAGDGNRVFRVESFDATKRLLCNYYGNEKGGMRVRKSGQITTDKNRREQETTLQGN